MERPINRSTVWDEAGHTEDKEKSWLCSRAWHQILAEAKFALASHLLGTVSASMLCSPSAVVVELLSAEGERKILFLVF